jgi:hypothetical protein
MPDKPGCSAYDPDNSSLGDSFVNLISIFQLLMGAEKRLNFPSPGVVPHWGRGDKDGTPFMLPLITDLEAWTALPTGELLAAPHI